MPYLLYLRELWSNGSVIDKNVEVETNFFEHFKGLRQEILEAYVEVPSIPMAKDLILCNVIEV